MRAASACVLRALDGSSTTTGGSELEHVAGRLRRTPAAVPPKGEGGKRVKRLTELLLATLQLYEVSAVSACLPLLLWSTACGCGGSAVLDMPGSNSVIRHSQAF